MHKTRVWIAMGCCLLAPAVFAQAQAKAKPGLFEITTTMTWQKSPFPPGMTMPAGVNSPFGGGAHTAQVCVTQAMIDKYGAPVPQSQGDCRVDNIVLKPNSMSADIACKGMMSAKGTVESVWTDGNTSKSKMHMIGAIQMGANSTPVEWTAEANSVYKGADCGSVKPLPMPK